MQEHNNSDSLQEPWSLPPEDSRFPYKKSIAKEK